MYGPNATSTSMDLGVSKAFAGRPNLLRMIEIAQKARDAPIVRGLHEQCKMLLCAPAGVAPGDKEWDDLVQHFVTAIGTVSSENQILAYCYKTFARARIQPTPGHGDARRSTGVWSAADISEGHGG